MFDFSAEHVRAFTALLLLWWSLLCERQTGQEMEKNVIVFLRGLKLCKEEGEGKSTIKHFFSKIVLLSFVHRSTVFM